MPLLLLPFSSALAVPLVADATDLEVEDVEVCGGVDEVDEGLRQFLVLVEVHELGRDPVLVVGLVLLEQD